MIDAVQQKQVIDYLDACVGAGVEKAYLTQEDYEQFCASPAYWDLRKRRNKNNPIGTYRRMKIYIERKPKNTKTGGAK